LVRDLEVPERAAALGVRLALRDPLPVEVRHLLDQVVIVQEDRAIRAYGERVLVAFDRDTGVVRRGIELGHRDSSCPCCALGAATPAAWPVGQTPSEHHFRLSGRVTLLGRRDADFLE
jgi:hypothetical protein